jgi:hypothetical protein
MKMSVRLLTAVLVNVALLFAFMQAPSLHVHAHEATGRHVAGFLHAHVPHVEAPLSDAAEWRDIDADEDAQFLNWTSITPSYAGLAPVTLVQSAVVLPAPAVSEWQTTILRLRAHDPPNLNSTPPRAPPV